MTDEGSEGSEIKRTEKLEEICFLWEKQKALCKQEKCGGHNKQCKQYVGYNPAKYDAVNTIVDYNNKNSEEKK